MGQTSAQRANTAHRAGRVYRPYSGRQPMFVLFGQKDKLNRSASVHSKNLFGPDSACEDQKILPLRRFSGLRLPEPNRMASPSSRLLMYSAQKRVLLRRGGPHTPAVQRYVEGGFLARDIIGNRFGVDKTPVRTSSAPPAWTRPCVPALVVMDDRLHRKSNMLDVRRGIAVFKAGLVRAFRSHQEQGRDAVT
jgi:hypothetical protein